MLIKLQPPGRSNLLVIHYGDLNHLWGISLTQQLNRFDSTLKKEMGKYFNLINLVQKRLNTIKT